MHSLSLVVALQSMVSAASRAVLLMLTIEPLSPDALVKILTVFPAPEVLKSAFWVAPVYQHMWSQTNSLH